MRCRPKELCMLCSNLRNRANGKKPPDSAKITGALLARILLSVSQPLSRVAGSISARLSPTLSSLQPYLSGLEFFPGQDRLLERPRLPRDQQETAWWCPIHPHSP